MKDVWSPITSQPCTQGLLKTLPNASIHLGTGDKGQGTGGVMWQPPAAITRGGILFFQPWVWNQVSIDEEALAPAPLL